MKTIIAGSRKGVTFKDVCDAMAKCPWTVTEVVSGGAWGVDIFGEEWADQHGIPVVRFDAAWTDLDVPGALIKARPDGTKYNVWAGYVRNERMACYAEALVAVWNGHSRGTADMCTRAEKHGLKVHVWVKIPWKT